MAQQSTKPFEALERLARQACPWLPADLSDQQVTISFSREGMFASVSPAHELNMDGKEQKH